jgi:flagellin-like hook-associated protein FlgL
MSATEDRITLLKTAYQFMRDARRQMLRSKSVALQNGNDGTDEAEFASDLRELIEELHNLIVYLEEKVTP